MMANTTYQLNSSLGERYSIDPNGLTIGRSRTNTIAINDPRISRLHARLLFAGGRYWIRDEKSHAGILVNGRPVSGQQEFKPGDILQIGSVTFWLTSAAQTASQPHSPVAARTKRTNLVYVGIAGVLLIILIIAIGSGGSMSNGNIQSQTLPTDTSTSAPQELKVTIPVNATQGGTVALPDGATINIPPGALQSDTNVTLQAVQDSNGPKSQSPDATATVGKIYKIDLGTAALKNAVTLELPFDPNLLPSDVEPGQVFLATFDETSGRWVYSGGTVDLNRNVITLPVTHASWWEPASWNWAVWETLLASTLKVDLAGMIETAWLIPTGCEQTGQYVRVVVRDVQNLVQGCIDKDDPARPKLRLVNLRAIFYEISSISGGGDYPPTTVLAPGDSLSFEANTKDRSPLVVNAQVTKEASDQLFWDLFLTALPGLNQIKAINQLKVRGMAVSCITNALGSVTDIVSAVETVNADHLDSLKVAQSIVKLMHDERAMQKIKDAAQFCKFSQASTWSTKGILQVGNDLSVIIGAVDYIASYISGNFHAEVDFYWTAPSTPTLTPTPAPLPTATPTPTDTPQPVSSLPGTVTQTSNCRYGPDWPYLYKYGFGIGQKVEAIGRDADGNWLYVQGLNWPDPCWIKGVQVQVNGDVMNLPDAYTFPQRMTISPFFEKITITGVSNSGGTVNVSWLEHIIRSDLSTEQGIEYIVEVWTCVNGKPNFSAIGTNETSASFQIDSSCGLTSHADVIGEDKEGFSLPAIIALP